MKTWTSIILVALMVLLGLLATSCGGGGGDQTTPIDPIPPGEEPGGGDPPDVQPIGVTSQQFTIPNGFTDLRGVASSQEYVYVADATTLYCFDKIGNLINFVAAPATIQGVAVFPPAPDVDGLDTSGYVFAGFPLIAHEPVSQYGYITIYGPNLDTLTTREDANKPDAPKFISLPNPEIIPPADVADFACLTVYDVTVDRFGSILLYADVDDVYSDVSPDWPRALQILNVWKGFTIEKGGQTTIQDDQTGTPRTVGVPCFDNAFGQATGDIGTLAVDSYFPFNRTDLTYAWYNGHYNLLRDFVGVSTISFNPVTETYSVGASVANGYGYNRVIGEMAGSAPGSFNQNPPMNPDGGLEDQDLSNGGPSGMGVDPLNDNVLICDPGNRRIQVFAPDTGTFLRQIGTGIRGNSGSNFLAPSSVSVDYIGNIFVCDVNNLRVLREKQPGLHFGNVGGTVKRMDNHTPIEGAIIAIGNELGPLAQNATNINGDYRFNYLKIGTYNLTCTKFGYDSDTAIASIISDTTVRVDFNLNPRTPATTGTYSGTIIDDSTNLPLSGVHVEIVGTSLTADTDDLGRYLVTNIPPGVYQAVFTLANYQTMTRDFEIISGTTTTEQLLQMLPE